MTRSVGEGSNTRNVRVVVRIRPPLGQERKQPSGLLQAGHDSASLTLQSPNARVNSIKNFCFDKVLAQEADQADVYSEAGIDQMVEAVANGFHATIFAYGQTGSGKTYTMEGFNYRKLNPGSPPEVDFDTTSVEKFGVIPRAIDRLFKATKLNKALDRRFTIRCSHVQVYNEQAYDLLNPSTFGEKFQTRGVGDKGNRRLGAGLRMRWCKHKDFYLENLFSYECSMAGDVLLHFKEGIKNKVMASHKLNLASSRSHSLFILEVESCHITTPEEIITSRLTLVDLAGSERAAITSTLTGDLKKESIFINKSLFTLRKVISALAESGVKPHTHVPYRDSKLTCLLKGSLGGSSIAMMIACLAKGDAYYEENLSTLEYASRARQIKNKVYMNEDPKTRVIRELREEVAFLRNQLSNSRFPGKDLPIIHQDAVDESGHSNLPEGCEDTFVAMSDIPDHSENKPIIEALVAKLEQSVGMIKNLTLKNQHLGMQNSKFHETGQKTAIENEDLRIENADLRDRVDFLESVMVFDEEKDGAGPRNAYTTISPNSKSRGVSGSDGICRVHGRGAGESVARGSVQVSFQKSEIGRGRKMGTSGQRPASMDGGRNLSLYTSEKAAFVELRELRQENEALHKRLQKIERHGGWTSPEGHSKKAAISPRAQKSGNRSPTISKSKARFQKDSPRNRRPPTATASISTPRGIARSPALPIRISTTGSVLPTAAIIEARKSPVLIESVESSPCSSPGRQGGDNATETGKLTKWLADRKLRRSTTDLLRLPSHGV
ncbi:hypothetical protein BSKO_03051 [Bryopsis sp. KO-2023]|nr:hypothetical protein BSKO_03051 [Bryopsis sp. KO-2023]